MHSSPSPGFHCFCAGAHSAELCSSNVSSCSSIAIPRQDSVACPHMGCCPHVAHLAQSQLGYFSHNSWTRHEIAFSCSPSWVVEGPSVQHTAFLRPVGGQDTVQLLAAQAGLGTVSSCNQFEVLSLKYFFVLKLWCFSKLLS